MRYQVRLVPGKGRGRKYEYIMTFGNGVSVTKIRGSGEDLATARADAEEQLADLAESESAFIGDRRAAYQLTQFIAEGKRDDREVPF